MSSKPTLLVSYVESYHDDLQRWLTECRKDNLRACGTALHPTPTINTLRRTNPMGRHNSLSGGNPRYTTHLVASHRSGQEEECSKDGYVGSLLNRKSDLSVRNEVLPYKQLIRPMMDYAFHAWSSAARKDVRKCCNQLSSHCYWCPLVRK